MDPIFPRELEREIFEIAAIGNRQHIPHLLLVCRRVHQWIDPYLYRVVDTSDAMLVAAVKAKTDAFLKHTVRHLVVDFHHAEEDLVKALLFGCPDVQTLHFAPDMHIDLLPALDALQLKTLSMWVDNPVSWASGSSMLERPMFLSITHLELDYDGCSPTEIPLTWDDWSHLASLPALTHLAFSEILARYLLLPTLGRCGRLQTIVAIFVDMEQARAFVEDFPVITDPRMVAIAVTDLFHDWVRQARGEDDYWGRAEAFIARKRRGDIDATRYLLED
ncbi:hypothetical protein R3P38DRAFT_2681107 [Favolaschia claudopus]|uniref:F-box domain-containing protein n=1 Tax=Favolaschia claudopus TaxID=2862362 RepID=A0AAW0E2Q0_9AGAR